MTRLNKLWNNCAAALKGVLQHPAMVAILLCAWVVAALVETNVVDGYTVLGNPALAPVFAVLALLVDRLTTRKWASWLLLPVYLSSSFLGVLDGFTETVAFPVICAAILPLCYLWVARERKDLPFIRQAAVTGYSFALTLIFIGALALVTFLILTSVEYLFEFENSTMGHVIAWFVFFYFIVLAGPLFVSFDESGRADGYYKIVEAIVNWVLSPALVVYTIVLYAYIIKIVVQWNLPRGGVAAMVLAFSVLLFLCRTYRRLQKRKPFEWFYKYSWLIVIPLLVLFWVGVFRRLTDYGWTSARYYLVLSGTVMTLISMWRGRRDSSKFYHTLCSALSVVFLATITVPGISQKSVSLRSQKAILTRQAEVLELLDDDGKFIDGQFQCADSTAAVSHRTVYQALLAIEKLDSDAPEKYFGIEGADAYLERLPDKARNYARAYKDPLYPSDVYEAE